MKAGPGRTKEAVVGAQGYALVAGGYNGEDPLIAEIMDCWCDYVRLVHLLFPWFKGRFKPDDGPDLWQYEALEIFGDYRRRVVEAEIAGKEIEPLKLSISSGQGAGKGALTSWILLGAMSTMPGLNCNVTANTERQLNTKTWRELALWHQRAINKHWFQHTATKFFHRSRPATWFCAAIPWSENNPDAFRGLHGEHAGVVFDEASDIADNIWDVVNGTLSTPGAWHLAFGNASRSTGRFRETFPDGSQGHRWINRTVDTRDCKMSNKLHIQNIIDDFGEDSDTVRVAVRGLPPLQAKGQYIGLELVNDCMSRTLDLDSYQFAGRRLGCDVAYSGNKGTDQTVIGERKGLRIFQPQRYHGKNTSQVADLLAIQIEEADPADPVIAVYIDGNGWGAGVVDQMMRRNYDDLVVNVMYSESATETHVYFNKRAECIGRFKALLMAGAQLPMDDLLRRELISVQTVQPIGKRDSSLIQIMSKAEMKRLGLRSPDSLDAFAMTCAETEQDIAVTRHHLALQATRRWAQEQAAAGGPAGGY